MFYSYELLCRHHGGRFATIWLLATNRRVSDTSIMKVDICKTVQEIIEVIIHQYPDHLPKSAQKRFSLYLSSMLMYGCVRAYKRKVIAVLREAIHISSLKRMQAIDAENPKKRHLVKQSQQLAKKKANNKAAEQNVLQQLELIPVPPLLPTESILLECESQQQPLIDESVQPFSFSAQDSITGVRLMNNMKISEVNPGIIVSRIADFNEVCAQPIEPSELEMLTECFESVMLQRQNSNQVERSNIAETVSLIDDKDQPEILAMQAPENIMVDENQNKSSKEKQNVSQSQSMKLQSIESLPPQKQKRKKRPLLDNFTKIDSKIMRKNFESAGIALRVKSAREDVFNIYKMHYHKGSTLLLMEGYKKLSDPLHKLFKRHTVIHPRDNVSHDGAIFKGLSCSSDISVQREETSSFKLGDQFSETLLNINQPFNDVPLITRIAPEGALETISEEKMGPMPLIDDMLVEKKFSIGNDLPVTPAISIPEASFPVSIHEQSIRRDTDIPMNENEIKERLTQLWEIKNLVDFMMLCPPGFVTRLVAAKTLDTLLIMHANRSIRLEQNIQKTPPHFSSGPIYIYSC